MLDILSLVATMNRPKLLVQSARFGVDDYRRDVHLPRILKALALPRNGAAILKLMEIEAEMNDLRLTDRAEYSIAKHVEVLIAIMGETRQLRTASRVA